MEKCVAYGSDNKGNYYVQICCNEEHSGQECGCRSLGENFSKGEAKELAEKKANELNTQCQAW